jgi:hypothetical protein
LSPEGHQRQKCNNRKYRWPCHVSSPPSSRWLEGLRWE